MAFRRQRRSMFRLRTWLRRSYRGAISEKIRFTYARFSAPPAAAALAVALSMSVASIVRKLPGNAAWGKLSFPRFYHASKVIHRRIRSAGGRLRAGRARRRLPRADQAL